MRSIENGYKNFNGFKPFEIILAFFICEARYGEPNLWEIQELLFNRNLDTEDYRKLTNLLKLKRPSELSRDFNYITNIYIPKGCIKKFRSFFYQPDCPSQIVLKTIHDNDEVNSKMIRDVIENYNYAWPTLPYFNILNFLQMGELFKRGRLSYFSAYPEKMEIIWPFLADKNYQIQRKVINLY